MQRGTLCNGGRCALAGCQSLEDAQSDGGHDGSRLEDGEPNVPHGKRRTSAAQPEPLQEIGRLDAQTHRSLGSHFGEGVVETAARPKDAGSDSGPQDR